jgi:hypothetical protein
MLTIQALATMVDKSSPAWVNGNIREAMRQAGIEGYHDRWWIDGWGTPIRPAMRGSSLELRSAGPDTTLWTDDDIVHNGLSFK